MNLLNRSLTIILFWMALTVTLVGCTAKKEQPVKEEPKPIKPEVPTFGLTEEQAAQTLAKIGDTKITVGQFAARIGEQSPYLRARYNAPEKRRDFLDNMINFELLALEAKKRGYDKSEDIEKIRKQRMVQEMMQELFDKDGNQLSDVSDQEIRQYYEEHNDEFNKPAQVRVSHILLKDKATAEKVLKKALAKPGDMQNFRNLVEEYSEDKKTKQRKGDLSFFSEAKGTSPTEPDIPLPIRQAAFSLEKHGDIFPSIIESDQGFHIIMLSGKRSAYNRSFEEARRMIQNRLWRTKREEAITKFVDELREKASIKQNLELLEQVKVETDNSTTQMITLTPTNHSSHSQKPTAKSN